MFENVKMSFPFLSKVVEWDNVLKMFENVNPIFLVKL